MKRVNSSAPYKIDLTDNFRSSVSQLKKAHYKKDTASGAAFEAVLDGYFLKFEKAPHAVPSSRAEPWPAKCHDERFKFYKSDFHMPGLSGASGQGRIMWLVCDGTTTVHVVWVYTHAQYGGRPSDKGLRVELNSAMEGAIKALRERAESQSNAAERPKG